MKRAVALTLGLLGCGQQPRSAAHVDATRSIQACNYTVEELRAEPAELEVTAHCVGRRITGFSRTEPASAPFIRVIEASARLAPHDAGWQFAVPLGEAHIRYRVDLEGIAGSARRFDTALRIGRSLVAPASTFLLEPEPLELGVPIDVRVRLPPGEDFASGLTSVGAPADRHFQLASHEVSVGTFAIFGRFMHSTLHVNNGTVELATADGALDVTAGAVQRWVSASARAVSQFYGVFPTPHALVLLLPRPNRAEVLFGKVLPQSSPGVALLLGENTTEPALYRDWILVHELFHIGFPSFQGEAKWLDEGSATYFEPIIRARAGYLTELEVWTEFARDMPQGLRAIEQDGLEHANDFRAIYWGGAIACLLADVAARQRSGNAIGLEAGFRALLSAGGNATQVWSLLDVTRVIDTALGSPILADIEQKYAQSGEPVALPALLARLGVVQRADGTVTLADHADLAPTRHAITFGTSH